MDMEFLIDLFTTRIGVKLASTRFKGGDEPRPYAFNFLNLKYDHSD
jgi:hypothetical protein